MTRLSDALKRAGAEAENSLPPPNDAMPPAAWQFAPVETMHVPDEPAPLSTHPVQPPRNAAAGGETAAGSSAVVASAPPIRVGDADRTKLVIGEGVEAAVVEQYRHLAAVLHHAQKASGTRSVMVTSAVASEGKTLTATNLALTLSQSYRRRVLLIDADLRRPRMREMFALTPTEGLTDSLTTQRGGRLPVEQVTPTLWVLTAGRTVPDPMSLLVSPAMKEILDDARNAFDWVVVDTPPIAILPDANLLSAMIDTTLLVVAAQSTPYPLVQRAAQAIGPGRILGVVLNRAEHAAVPVYQYGYPGDLRPSPRRTGRWLRWLRKSKTPTTAVATASAVERPMV